MSTHQVYGTPGVQQEAHHTTPVTPGGMVDWSGALSIRQEQVRAVLDEGED